VADPSGNADHGDFRGHSDDDPGGFLGIDTIFGKIVQLLLSLA
jgi:hypothetical protein